MFSYSDTGDFTILWIQHWQKYAMDVMKDLVYYGYVDDTLAIFSGGNESIELRQQLSRLH